MWRLVSILALLGGCAQEVWVTLHNVPEEGIAAELSALIDGAPPGHALQRLSPIETHFIAELGNRPGSLTLQAAALDGSECVIGKGEATTVLGGTGHYQLDIELAPAPGCVLHVETRGPASGTVTSVPMGIDCGTACDFRFMNGREPIRLVANPGPLSYLGGWSGGCNGTDAICELVVRQPTRVIAAFDGQVPVVVEKQGSGDGTIVSDPPGISCAPTCSAPFAGGAEITLIAQPNPTSVFAGWSGACSGTEPCRITLDGSVQVAAQFIQNSLVVTKSGAAGGSITSQPSGIDCGSGCTGVYQRGTSVTLLPRSTSPLCFAGFTGACTGTGPCTVKLDGPLSVDARFTTCVFQQPFAAGVGGRKVWGSGPSDVWITGETYLRHWTGSAIESVSLSNTTGIFTTLGIWGSGPRDIWVGGGNGGTLEHFDGTAWGMGAQPLTDYFVSYYGLWGTGPNNVWAVGRDYSISTASAVVHWNGFSWSGRIPSDRSIQLNGVWGSGASDIWAVGSLGIYHGDGSVVGFKQVAGVAGGWNAVWGSGPNDVWAIGAMGAILHFDGSAWSGVSSGVTADLQDVWGSSPNDVWAVGDAGTVLRWDGVAWTQISTVAPTANFGGVWGAGADDIWLVGSTILRYHP